MKHQSYGAVVIDGAFYGCVIARELRAYLPRVLFATQAKRPWCSSSTQSVPLNRPVKTLRAGGFLGGAVNRYKYGCVCSNAHACVPGGSERWTIPVRASYPGGGHRACRLATSVPCCC